MMRIKLDDGRELLLSWFHERYKEPMNGISGHTYCYLEKADTRKIISYGLTQCSVSDNYNKETGRKISLTRALSDLPKKDRATIWNAYLNRNTERKNDA